MTPIETIRLALSKLDTSDSKILENEVLDAHEALTNLQVAFDSGAFPGYSTARQGDALDCLAKLLGEDV